MERLEEDGEENLIAAASLILRVLESNKKITNEAKKILADLGTRLSSIAKSTESEEGDEDEDKEITDIKGRINSILDMILNWESNESLSNCDPEETQEYLKTVDEARRLAERLEGLNLSKYDVLLMKVNDVFHTSMARIEEEFRHMIVHNSQNFEPQHMSFRSSEDDGVDESTIISFGGGSFDDLVQRDLVSRGPEAYIVDLVNPRVIPVLKSIANLMCELNYGQECSEAFISARKAALDDCLFNLKVKKLSMEDVLKMEWVSMNSMSKRWTKAIGIFIRVYLTSEKFLCEQIFGQGESLSSICFAESSKASFLQLLNFAHIIADDPRQPEKLLRVLDMYEVLTDLIPDIKALNSDENGSYIRTECQDILSELGDCVKMMFIEFKNSVGSNVSNSAFPGGGIHPLTRYVMNYSRALTDYSDSLNACLKEQELFADDQDSSSSPVKNPSSFPMAFHFRSLMSVLEGNLEEKSNVYKEDALKHIFLMNNIHYMAEKVKGSELRTVLSDDWIRKRNWKFQQYVMGYERATLSSILNLLKVEGFNHWRGTNLVSKTLLRERLNSFYIGFKVIYKSQTGWSIPDSQLREDLRVSISLKVIQAYRTFVGRHMNITSERRYIKYSADDLENYILDLFEGAPRSLPSFHRK